MAKTKKKTKKIGGPFLASAVFCESIMEDTSKKMSALGILDGVEFWLHADTPPDLPSKEQPMRFIQNMLVIFRTGDSPGKHRLRLVAQSPDGKRKEAASQDIELPAPLNSGFNLKTQINMSVYSSGVFWLDVILDGKRFTRMPLNVSIRRLPPTVPDSAKQSNKRR